MAVINFYDDIFASAPVQREISAGMTVEDAINGYLDSRGKTQLVESYDIETGETKFVSLDNGGFKVVVLAGDEEKSLDYMVEEADVLSIVLVPEQLDEGAASVVSMIGSLASAAGSILAFVPGLNGLGIGLMVVGAGLTLWAGISSYMNNKDSSSSSSSDTALSSEQNLSISGGSNQDIIGQRFPFIMGKHLVNPAVLGSPYNITRTKNLRGEDAGSYFRCLYLVGYAPLRLTNIKIGSILAAYNSTPSAEDADSRNTVMHGLLQGYNDDDTGDILKKWKNNDLKIEILQKGSLASDDTDRYGTLYPQVCRQTEINANLLNIKDKEIEGLANRIYKGVSVPNGFKNNSVKFTGSCPKKIEVELDFPNGLYATRVHTDDGKSNNLYYNLPVRIAVQWRFVKSGQISSDADDPYSGGWKDFTSVEFTDGSSLKPQTYTLGQMSYDYNSSLGTTGYKDSGWFSLGDSSTYEGSKWLGAGKTFNFGAEDVDAALNSVSTGTVTKSFWLHATECYSDGEWSSVDKDIAVSETFFKNCVGNFSETTYEYQLDNKEVVISGTSYKCSSGKWEKKTGLDSLSEKDRGITDHSYSVTAFKDSYGVNERSYVASYELTDEECRTLINYSGDNVTTDCLEVRVLRVNPSYFDETNDSIENWTNMTYQDLCRWKYLRTFSFDKDAFKEALDEAVAAGEDIDNVHAADYPQRPLSKEDMDKFVLVAVSLKQDAAETGGSSLSQVSCIAESFCPNCVDDGSGGKEWVPENISLQYGYYHKYKIKDSNGKLKTKIEEAVSSGDIENYKNNISSHADGYYKAVKGNDFVSQLKAEIFSDSGKNETDYGSVQWLLTDEVKDKYVTNNTASVFALALVGRHLGIDAKTYDNINMEALTEFYGFCSDLTDGTPKDSTTEPDLSDPATLKHFFLACNGVVSNEVKMETLLQKILMTGRSSLRRDDWNRYEVVIGRNQDYPVFLLNQQNVLSYSNSRSLEEMPSGLQVQFIDESDNYSQNDIFIMADGEDYKNPTREIEGYSFQYVTNREQIWTLGRFNLGCRIAQRETYTRTVGKCGHLLSYGDMVLMADSTLLIGAGNGGRIQRLITDAQKIYGFVVDEPFEYKVDSSGSTSMGVTVLQSKRGGRSRVVTLRLADSALSSDGEFVGPEIVFDADAPAARIDYYTDDGIKTREYRQSAGSDGKLSYRMSPGLTNTVILKSPVSIDDEASDETSLNVYVKPSVDDIVAFGTYEEITQKAIITAIKPKENEQFELTLLPYDEALYEQGTTMAEFRSHMSNVRRDSSLAEFSNSASQADVNSTAVNVAGNISSSIADIKDSIASLYSNHIVTLYRDSGSQLTKDDLPSDTGVYSFKDNTFVFIKDGEETEDSGGWSASYPEKTEHTVYVTTATAFGQEETDAIDPSEWASPIPIGLNGADGYNAKTISLYMRLDSAPSSSMLPGRLLYKFATGELEGDFGGWSDSIPDVAYSSAAGLYEIHATALSTDSYDYIEKDEWSLPVKISDGVTTESIKKVLDMNPNLLAGNVSIYCSGTVIAFAVDEGGLALCDQKTTISFSVKQQGFDLSFTFGKLPEIDGVTYVIEEDSITVRVKKGTFLAFQELPIPVVYREFIEVNIYMDENGEMYLDDEGNPYSVYSYRDTSSTFTYNCSLLPQKGGRQRTDCETDDDVDSLQKLVLGDYFCFTGESTDRFKQGEVYIWTGEEWIVDTYSAHIVASLDSILSTNSDTMAEKSQQLSEHLATNSKYLEKLLSKDNSKFTKEICANTAFINTLVGGEIFADTLVANTGYTEQLVADKVFTKAFSADTAVVQELYGNKTFLKEISTRLVKVTGAETLYDTLTKGDETMFPNLASYTDEKAAEEKRNAIINGLKALGLDATVADNETTIAPGYINTDLINADAVVIGASIEKTDDSGEVVYKKDSEGNLVLDSDGNPVPETVKLTAELSEAKTSMSSMQTKIERLAAYQPLYYRTNNKISPPSAPSDSDVVTDNVLGKWTTCSTKRTVTYTYVCYRYKDAETGSYIYTGVSLEAATIISGGRIITDLIDADSLFAQNITMKSGGVIMSSQWKKNGGTIGSDGSITGYSEKGWAIDFSGRADFVNTHMTNVTVESGTFTDITAVNMKATNMTAIGGTFTGATIGGVINAKVFHFSEIFSKSATGYTDSAGTWHDFANGDMWLVEA